DLRGWEWRYLWQQCRSDASSIICRRPMPISCLAVSHDGRWVAVGETKGGLTVWDLRSHDLVATLPAGEREVRAAFSPCEPLLAFSHSARDSQNRFQYQVHFWDPLTMRQRPALSINERCVGLAFSQDGQALVTSTWGPPG